MPAPHITVSIVSHRQNSLVNELLGDLARHCAGDIPIVLTENVPDAVSLATEPFADRMQLIRNPQPRGYGANHNAAFAHCRTPFFCVANPDIRLAADPFPALLDSLRDERIGVAGPLVRNPAGAVEDSARRFPTAGSLLMKFFSEKAAPDYPADRGPVEVDWIAGMFMLLRSEAFRSASGFDEAYFMYYEDVDLCRRLRGAGKSVLYNPGAEVVHDARRGSRRDFALMRRHAASMLRFLLR
jgi:N-acetylglucosaminyl-diphospho-decaprenol L-rhamnosyltransferase